MRQTHATSSRTCAAHAQEEVHNPFGNYLRASMEEVDVTLAAKNHQFAGQAAGGPQPLAPVADPSAAGGAATEPLGGREIGFDFTTGMKVHRRDIRGVIDALVLKVCWLILLLSFVFCLCVSFFVCFFFMATDITITHPPPPHTVQPICCVEWLYHASPFSPLPL